MLENAKCCTKRSPLTRVGFEPTPFRTRYRSTTGYSLVWRLRPLGHLAISEDGRCMQSPNSAPHEINFSRFSLRLSLQFFTVQTFTVHLDTSVDESGRLELSRRAIPMRKSDSDQGLEQCKTRHLAWLSEDHPVSSRCAAFLLSGSCNCA